MFACGLFRWRRGSGVIAVVIFDFYKFFPSSAQLDAIRVHACSLLIGFVLLFYHYGV